METEALSPHCGVEVKGVSLSGAEGTLLGLLGIGARKKPLVISQAAWKVEDNGLEPMTYALPARRSPN